MLLPSLPLLLACSFSGLALLWPAELCRLFIRSNDMCTGDDEEMMPDDQLVMAV